MPVIELSELIAHRYQRVMRRINRWPAPRWVRIWMLAATRAGDSWLWYAMGLFILVLGGATRFRALAAAGAWRKPHGGLQHRRIVSEQGAADDLDGWVTLRQEGVMKGLQGILRALHGLVVAS